MWTNGFNLDFLNLVLSTGGRKGPGKKGVVAQRAAIWKENPGSRSMSEKVCVGVHNVFTYEHSYVLGSNLHCFLSQDLVLPRQHGLITERGRNSPVHVLMMHGLSHMSRAGSNTI